MSNLRDVLVPLMQRAAGPGRRRRGIAVRALGLLPGTRRTVGVDVATRRFVTYAVLPLWLGAGFADYLFHRRTKIEETSGPRESAIHIAMMTETGVPLLMGLFLEVNALVLALMGALFVAHEATAYWDVNYAETRRTVTPNEQHAHSFLEVIPFMALSMTACLNWEQSLALFGMGPERPRFRLRAKRPPASPRYVAALLAAIGLFGALPYAEELWRCYRATPTLAATPPAADEATANLRVDAPLNEDYAV